MAVRYPKPYWNTYNNNQMSSVVGASATYYLGEQPWDHLAIAPARHGSVRKVAFWLDVQNNSAVTDLIGKLRIYPGSSVAARPYSIIQQVLIPGVTHFFGPSNPFGVKEPGDDGQEPEDLLFPRKGATTQTSADALIVISQFRIEFDRFDPQDATFFEVWDAITGDDTVIPFQYALEVDSGPAATSVTIRGFGIEIVQAPSSENNSCTYLELRNAFNTSGTGPTQWDEDIADPTQGQFRFRYREGDWDGITAVHLLVFGGNKANTTTTSVRLNRIDSNGTVSVGGEAVTTLKEEQFGNWGVANQYGYYRTENLLSLLVDGNDYTADIQHDAASGSGASTSGDLFIVVEIIQKGMSRTTTYHTVRTNQSSSLTGETTSVGRSFFHMAPFDPAHYQDVPDSSFLRREVFYGLNRAITVNDPEVVLGLQAIFEDLVFTPPAIPPLVLITPSKTGNNGDDKWEWVQSTITSNDPVKLAGARMMVFVKTAGHTWTGANNEHPGAMGLAYTYTVPSEETPELGPLFQLGAFDPEGCASTAAGLGDNPGVLVIANGSAAPKKFNPVANRITDAGIPPPFCGEEPSATTADTASSATGGLVPGVYTYRYTFCNSCTRKESDPNPVDIVVDGSARSPALEVTLSFAGVQIPSDPQIDEICIYRTVIGGAFPVMAKVGTLDLSASTIFVDALNDAQLDFINDGLSLLNGPMPCVPVVAEFRNRLFGMGDIPNLSPPGTVSVTAESDEIVGDPDTEFDRCVVGKFIQIQGDCNNYEILKIFPGPAGSPGEGLRLKVDPPYEGVTDTGLLYTICGRPNRVYISEPLEPECWPAANFLDVEPGDGDRLIGAVSNFNSLIICKRRKTYRIGFREQPATEIIVPTRISSDIGCIAPRSFAQVASGSVWLADRGLARYDGRAVSAVPESSAANDLFINPDNPRYVRRDANGRVIGAVGVFYPKREQYLLLLPTVQTNRGGNLIMVWDTELRNITFFEFCQEFLSMEVAKDADGNERVYLGDTNGFVWIFDVGDTDGVGFPNATGTVRGTITSVGVDGSTGASFLEDSAASFIIGGVPELGGLSGLAGLSGLSGDSEMGLAGACVFFRPVGSGPNVPWQTRFVYASTSTRLYVTPNWGSELPDLTETAFEYMLGPIDFDAVFKASNRGTDDYLKRNWKHAIDYEPEAVSSQLRVELLNDFETEDPISGQQVPGEVRKFRVFDLSFAAGRQTEMVERDLHNYLQVRLRNFAPDEPVRILNHLVMVTPRSSR